MATSSSAWLMFSDHYPEILIAIACFLIFSLLLSARSSSKDSLPYNWPIFGMLPAIISNNQFNDFTTARLRKMGWTFIFKGPWLLDMDYIFTCDPSNINHMFNDNFENYPKGELGKVFDIFGNNIFNADGDLWHDHRKMAQTILWDGNYRTMQATFIRNKMDNALIPILDSAACKRKPVDLQDVLLRFTFDTSCFSVLAADPESLTMEFPPVPFSKAADQALDAALTRHITPRLIWKLKRFFNVGSERTLAVAWKVIDSYIYDKIAELKAKRKLVGKINSYDAVSFYMDNFNIHDDKFLRDNAFTYLLAQRNTQSLTMTWLFYALFENPKVELKILSELKSIVDESSERKFNDGFALFDSNMIQSAIYLHATLCEALRIYPPVPFEIKDAHKADVLPSGHKVRAGEKILFSPYAMARMKGIWGDDCLEFKPERWITGNGTLKHEPAYKFFAFSAGPRICLGKELSFTQMKMVVATIIYNFHLQMVKGHVVEQSNSILMDMKHGLMVQVRKRSVM
uniref:Noroxomaritidine synthase 2 n=1 Tax=Narcissus pseudonarcissus TaxID=39639 RepID=C96T2_NARPS|nr:RecName: Full=Noroxomaritidine synthase 2; AltName: Full=CYP96T2; AltName: Full=Cytochrome P450 96T2 [Narcissus pseudonarcissus]AUG71943.1 noroxomaritidine synthase 2 [Narcissus pseudonarcissus]